MIVGTIVLVIGSVEVVVVFTAILLIDEMFVVLVLAITGMSPVEVTVIFPVVESAKGTVVVAIVDFILGAKINGVDLVGGIGRVR